jgi:hypothetical protein
MLTRNKTAKSFHASKIGFTNFGFDFFAEKVTFDFLAKAKIWRSSFLLIFWGAANYVCMYVCMYVIMTWLSENGLLALYNLGRRNYICMYIS